MESFQINRTIANVFANVLYNPNNLVNANSGLQPQRKLLSSTNNLFHQRLQEAHQHVALSIVPVERKCPFKPGSAFYPNKQTKAVQTIYP